MKQLFNQNVKKMRKMLKCVNFIKIDLSFVFMFVLAIILDEVWLYVLFVVFICLHEFAHFFVAKKLGYMASKIHLTFFWRIAWRFGWFFNFWWSKNNFGGTFIQSVGCYFLLFMLLVLPRKLSLFAWCFACELGYFLRSFFLALYL